MRKTRIRWACLRLTLFAASLLPASGMAAEAFDCLIEPNMVVDVSSVEIETRKSDTTNKSNSNNHDNNVEKTILEDPAETMSQLDKRNKDKGQPAPFFLEAKAKGNNLTAVKNSK